MLINSVFLLALTAGSTWATALRTVDYTIHMPVWDVSGSYARLVKVLKAPSRRWSIHQKYFQVPNDDHSDDYYDESDTWSNKMTAFSKPMHLFNYRNRKTTTTTTVPPITKPTPTVASTEDATMNPMLKELKYTLSTYLFHPASLQSKKKHKKQRPHPKETSTEYKLSLASHSATLLCDFSRRQCRLPDDVQLVKLQQPLVYATPGNKMQSQRYLANTQLSPRHVTSMFY
ncbi:hypothetical protein AWZ03_004588 [Drosophila navojoa]|uniref:Uncharacterized protein n=1 Tax=Drosophila navojoa TaxID=7232 RepID=A0A484BJR7_DRONA|nr:hypothetical protein AWZ03_004588 [Drosophila navojoa]